MRQVPALPTFDEIVALAAAEGIEHVGVAPAGVLERARSALHDRLDRGLDGGLPFTFRNPDRSTDPARAMAGARSLIVGARSYALDEPDGPSGPRARVGRFAWVDHYEPMRRALQVIAKRIKAAGERAVVLCDDNRLVDREAAYQAGLGWFGKNANLLLPGAGSWFTLGSIVTTATYEPAAAPVPDGCGGCRRCLDACPTGAIISPGVIDANRCLAWVLQKPGTIPSHLREAVGDRIYGCDDCQDVCPPTVRFAGRHRPPPPADDLEAWVAVLDLLDADDDELLARHGRWYIAGRDPRWLRRNALVVLGNVGDPDDERTAATLDGYRNDDDDLLAEHAAWATEAIAARSPHRAAARPPQHVAARAPQRVAT